MYIHRVHYVLLIGVFCFNNLASSQGAPKMTHSNIVRWPQPGSMIWLEDESHKTQYLKADLYISLDTPYPPTKIGPIGTLLINPGALVYFRLGIVLFPDANQPWLTGGIINYPDPSPYVGLNLRVQLVAYDAKNPGRVVLSKNAVTFYLPP